VVNNVETFVNIAAAHDGKPLTHKMLTIAGAVKSPATMKVPIGITFRECIEYAGGLTTDDPVMVIGGLMMGTNSDNLDTPITKTSTVSWFCRAHITSSNANSSRPRRRRALVNPRATKCRYCTEFCPRYCSVYAVEPHQVMRTPGLHRHRRGLF